MTMVHTPQIALKEIDLDHLEDVDDNREAVEFAVRLSQTPPPGWIAEFEQAYKQMPFGLRPPVHVQDDTLRVIYLPRYASELPDFFRFLGSVVRRANNELRRSEELQTSDAQEAGKIRLREALSRLHLP